MKTSLISTSLYGEIFDQVFDISDVKSLKIVSKVLTLLLLALMVSHFQMIKCCQITKQMQESLYTEHAL